MPAHRNNAMAVPQVSPAEFSTECNRDVFRAFRAMPRLTVVVALLLALQTALEYAAADIIPESSLLGFHIFSIVYYALFTPFFIAVHRFVLLGEVTRGYRLDWRGRRFQLFFGWAFAVFLITRIPSWLFSLSTYWPVRLFAWFSLIVSIVVLLRSMILFPAIAVDAPGATLGYAFEDSRGRRGWLILRQVVVAYVPSVLFVMAAAVVGAFVPHAASAVQTVTLALVMFFWMTLAVVVASRLYLVLGNHLNRAA
jgi:hypothetical protein